MKSFSDKLYDPNMGQREAKKCGWKSENTRVCIGGSILTAGCGIQGTGTYGKALLSAFSTPLLTRYPLYISKHLPSTGTHTHPHTSSSPPVSCAVPYPFPSYLSSLALGSRKRALPTTHT